MLDHSDNGLRAIIKSLRDVVAPALAADDAIARQELHFAQSNLQFLLERIDLIHLRERFTLRHYVTMAKAVRDAAEGKDEINTIMAPAITVGDEVLTDPTAGTVAYRAATSALTAGLREVIRTSGDVSDPIGARLKRLVVERSEDLIEMNRSWYLPLGFDPAPNEVNPIQEWLAVAADDGASRRQAAAVRREQ
jgi:hypothetical protein